MTVDKSRRHHHIYEYAYPKPACKCRPDTTHESPQNDNLDSIQILTTNNNNIDLKKQMALIQNDHDQNLGALDIQAQNLSDLEALAIKPTFTQPFSTAPDLIKKFSPAQVLMHHDPDGHIAANLAHWRQAHDDGAADLAGLKPALIWCKIVEGQEPPELAADDAGTNCPLQDEAHEEPAPLAATATPPA